MPPSRSTPAAPTSHRLQFDDRGQAIPPTDAERRERSEAIQLALAELAAMPDDPAGSDEAFWRAIDEGRPERPLFRGLYES